MPQDEGRDAVEQRGKETPWGFWGCVGKRGAAAGQESKDRPGADPSVGVGGEGSWGTAGRDSSQREELGGWCKEW